MGHTTTYLLLMRHGENDWVGTNRLAGRTSGVHLNEKGRQQAEALADLLSQQPIAAVYSSPLVRCVETAEPLATRLNLPLQEEAGIIEVDYGSWQGAELKKLAATPEWQKVQHYPSHFRFPGGETLREVQARAVSTIEALVERHPDQVIALFSHGDVLRTTLAHFLGVPLDSIPAHHCQYSIYKRNWLCRRSPDGVGRESSDRNAAAKNRAGSGARCSRVSCARR